MAYVVQITIYYIKYVTAKIITGGEYGYNSQQRLQGC